MDSSKMTRVSYLVLILVEYCMTTSECIQKLSLVLRFSRIELASIKVSCLKKYLNFFGLVKSFGHLI